MAGGSLADADSQARLGDFIAGMEEMARTVRAMGFETPGVDEEALAAGGGREQFAAFIEEELRAGEGEPGDDFGLSLSDLKLDGNYGKSRATAAALLGSGFTLNLSGWGTDVMSSDTGAEIRLVEPSTITATIGLRSEGDKVPFVLPEGARPRVRVDLSNRDYATGRLGRGPGYQRRLLPTRRCAERADSDRARCPVHCPSRRLWLHALASFRAWRTEPAA